MPNFVNIFSNFSDFFSFVEMVLALIAIVFLVIGFLTNIFPALWRFGLSLLKKAIYIVSSGEESHVISEDLLTSNLIKERNIKFVDRCHISTLRDASLIIIDSKYVTMQELKRIIENKKSQCGLIVYCPPTSSKLTSEQLDLINSETFTTLCNLRGRLVNDTLLMMLSTSFTTKETSPANLLK